MKKLVISALLIAMAAAATAQSHLLSVDHQNAMKKLSFLAGDWQGSGWAMGPDGQKHSFNQTETIRPGLDGVIMTVEGIGMTNGSNVHHAFAVISADIENKNYNFQSFLFNGRGGNFTGTMPNDSTFVWEIPNPNAPMKYTITVSDGTWKEIGEMKRADKWTQFFEMTLSKK